MDWLKSNINQIPILHALSAFVQSFRSSTAAVDMEKVWESVRWSPLGALATKDLFLAVLRDYDTVVETTCDLDSSLRLQPLTPDAIHKQVRSVAPAWAQLAVAMNRRGYNTFE